MALVLWHEGTCGLVDWFMLHYMINPAHESTTLDGVDSYYFVWGRSNADVGSQLYGWDGEILGGVNAYIITWSRGVVVVLERMMRSSLTDILPLTEAKGHLEIGKMLA